MREVKLTPELLKRFQRQCILPQFGVEGQERLLGSKVLIVGVGGLGCPQALYLAAAGVGRIGLVDFDRVDITNVHRQVLFGPEDVGRLKVEVARERLKRINPDCEIDIYPVRFTKENALDLLRDYHCVLDGTDNFATRYLINDAAFFLKKPNIYGSIFQFEAQVSVFCLPEGPCYRCLFPEPPKPGEVPSCAEAGVIGVLPGIVGVVQATEAIKILTGVGKPLSGRLLILDALTMTWQALELRKDPDCPLCGENPTIRSLLEYKDLCGPIGEQEVPALSAEELAQLLEEKHKSVVVIDVRNPEEREEGFIQGSLFIPLKELEQRIDEIYSFRDKTLVLYCKVGGRSARAARLLKEKGFEGNVYNLEGGIVAWNKLQGERAKKA